MSSMRETRPLPLVPAARPAAPVRHLHQWQVVAIEEDAFGRVAMRQCDCGIHHFITAA